MALSNDGSTSCPRASHATRTRADRHAARAVSWDNFWYIELRPAACSEQTVSGGCQRSSLDDLGYLGLRAFDKAFLSRRELLSLPSTVSVGHQGQRGRALLI